MGPPPCWMRVLLRIVLELAGETIISAESGIGFLHTGIEKEFEQKHYQQGVTLTDRADYLPNLSNNLAYALAVERLVQLQVPPPAQRMRVLMPIPSLLPSPPAGLGADARPTGA